MSRVLILIDVYGWAFDFIAQAIAKYSKHDITIRQFFSMGDIGEQDVVFYLNTSLLRDIKADLYCVGIHSETTSSDGIVKGYENICITQSLYNKFTTLYPDEHIHLIRNGVDVDTFKPRQDLVRPDKFVVGWAGNPRNPVKRFPLLRELPFEVKAMGNWGPQRFQVNRNRKLMTDFYADIDAYVCVSESEGMPLPILEAAASGLPIVSTPAGGISEFVDSEWLVPIDNPMPSMIEKLTFLKEDLKLRRCSANSNLQKALKDWNWKDRVKEYDRVFEG